MSDGSVCTAEELAFSNSTHGTRIVCLTRGDSIGLTLVAESGFISLVAVLGVFVQIFRNAFRTRRLIRRPTDIYILSLFSFDLIAALGTFIYVKWVHDGKVDTGGFCTAEGIVVQLGLAGSALATLAIAIHTFVVVVWGAPKHQYFLAYTTVGLTWLFLIAFIAVSVSIHTHGSDYNYTPDGYWCWISNQYRTEQYTGQYLWIWIAMFASFLTYVPLFFLARGNVTVSQTHWWKIQIPSSSDVVQDTGRERRSIKMIAYPLVFAVVALPYSAIRWKTRFGSSAHSLPTATFAVYFLFGLSGAFNVLLIIFTRSDLLFLPNRNGIPPVALSVGSFESAPSSSIPGSGARQRPRGDQPVPLGPLPGEDDGGWRLPAGEHEPV